MATSWAWLISSRQQNYSAQQNFCGGSARYAARPPSTRHIKSAGLLSRRVGSSTGMKYRFSIGHSLTLGRFRIKLPGPGECGLYSSHSFKPAPVLAIHRRLDCWWESKRFVTLSRGARCHSSRNVMAGAKKNSRPIQSLYPTPYPPFPLPRCIHLGKALMRPGRSVLYPADRSR